MIIAECIADINAALVANGIDPRRVNGDLIGASVDPVIGPRMGLDAYPGVLEAIKRHYAWTGVPGASLFLPKNGGVDMARAVGNRVGAFDGSGAAQDVIDTDSLQGPINLLTGSADNIPAPNGSPFNYNGVRGGNFLIASAGVDAIVLAAPVAGIDDNISCSFQDVGGHAHTITSTGNLNTGTAGKTGVVTFSGTAGAIVSFRAYNGKWNLTSLIGVTLTS